MGTVNYRENRWWNDENLWMTQEQISKLFEKAKATINEHIKNIYEEEELKEEFTMRKFGSLKMTHNNILNNKGTIFHKKALEKAHEEYDKYMKTHLTQAEKDYLEIMGEDIKKLK